MAIDGDTLAVAASYEASCATGIHPAGMDDNGCAISGAVYVFRRRGSAWAPEAYLKPFNTDKLDEFGVSLALDGDTLVVGAFHEDGSASGVASDGQSNAVTDSGAAYVFRRVDGAWQQDAYLKAFDPQEGQEFGWSVAVSGNLVAVGARLEDADGTSDSGAVYLFRRNVSLWIPETRLQAPAPAESDFFGYSVAADGDVVLVIGAPYEDSSSRVIDQGQEDNGIDASGAAYVFRRSGPSWLQDVYLKAPNAGATHRFGASVAIRGGLVAVGAIGEASGATGADGALADGAPDDDSVPNSGAAYLFRHTGGAWRVLAYVKASNTAEDDELGTSVALSDDALVVGAPYENQGGNGLEPGTEGGRAGGTRPNSGAVYLFH